jgi:hypothetical protein
MNIRQIALTAISIFCIIIFFNLPLYNSWLHERVLTFVENIDDDLENMSIEDRRVRRWGATYTDAISIKKYLDSSHVKNQLLLIPPKEYVHAHFATAIVPEPIIFYYFAGLKTALPSSKNVYDANCALVIEHGSFGLKELMTRKSVDSVLLMYKQVKPKS